MQLFFGLNFDYSYFVHINAGYFKHNQISQHCIAANALHGCDDTRGKQITVRIAYGGHFRPAMPQKTLISASLDIMLTGMARLQTGGIHYAGGTLTETTLFLCVRKNAV